jgi:hypothetical protein
MESQFNQPKKKKKQVWEDLAKKMISIGKYNVTGAICDNKFRTMMTTYRKIKDKLKSSGSGTGCKWPYFDIIDEQYGFKAAVQPHPDLIRGSLEEENNEEHVGKKGEVEKKTENEKNI